MRSTCTIPGSMRKTLCVLFMLAALVLAARAVAGDFGMPGGPQPPNLGQIADRLREDPYDLELLISFGTSKGGSAGHLALALRDSLPGDDMVYSANFYADRSPEHEKGFYTADLMLAIPKQEYLFGTASSLGETASFGLDFGEIYKRSVIGVRVYGVPTAEKAALAAYFRRINDDFHHRAADTEYHRGEIRYDYLRLNCAKTIGSAFKYGAGYADLDVTAPWVFSRRKVVAALNANIPTEMALKLMEQWHGRGFGMNVVLYRKYRSSAYVDPHEEEKVAFKDLPNRFPSVLSRDFRNEQGEYEDFDNLYAMYLLHNLGRYGLRTDERSGSIEFDIAKRPMAYAEAAERARRDAESDSAGFLGRLQFRPKGTRIGDAVDGPQSGDTPGGDRGGTAPARPDRPPGR